LNWVIRTNDYSQSYKHWCVVNLALLSGVQYDLFFRLRFDLRTTKTLHSLRFATLRSSNQRVVTFKLRPWNPISMAPDELNATASFDADRIHFVSATRIHSSNFDIADFGFMGPVPLIEGLSRLWWYCLSRPGSPLAPFPFVRNVSSRTLYSEYNLMLWRIVFENKWTVDSGGLYLRVSRFGARKIGKGRR
jgi:hypothetical protein